MGINLDHTLPSLSLWLHIRPIANNQPNRNLKLITDLCEATTPIIIFSVKETFADFYGRRLQLQGCKSTRRRVLSFSVKFALIQFYTRIRTGVSRDTVPFAVTHTLSCTVWCLLTPVNHDQHELNPFKPQSTTTLTQISSLCSTIWNKYFSQAVSMTNTNSLFSQAFFLNYRIKAYKESNIII